MQLNNTKHKPHIALMVVAVMLASCAGLSGRIDNPSTDSLIKVGGQTNESFATEAESSEDKTTTKTA